MERRFHPYYYSVTALKEALIGLPKFHDTNYEHHDRWQVMVREPISLHVLAEQYPGPTAPMAPKYTFVRDHKLQDWVLISID